MFTTLVRARDLEPHIGAADWVLIDCRHDLADHGRGLREYRAGHIPGAVFADLEHDLAGAKTGANGRHPLPDRAALVAFLRRAGATDEAQIVAYDAQGGMFASRLWWLARWLGHEAVAVLDGGLAAWLEEGFELSTVVPEHRPGTLGERAPLAGVASLAEVEANLATASSLVIDARAAERYRGEVEPLDRVPGHIPGALNRPYQANLAANGRFKDAATLRDEFADLLGGHDAAAVISQCGSGVSACHNLLAMQWAGLSGARLYPGSWSEWSADPARPVARGS